MCVCVVRVQTADLSSFQTTSFHTRLSFLDGETDEGLLEEEEEEDEEEEEEEEESCQRPGREKQRLSHR